MLAAASPEREKFPSLFHLALELLSMNKELPEPLSRHMELVSRQALEVLVNPATVSANTLPEAIQLALQLRSSDRLRRAFNPDLHRLTAAQARNLLSLEQNRAASH
ncbi:hypothetical protein NKH80_22495 [Mesorhizobium sp. M0904]|uniref:hypothetical protein n=1 Tax=Mesorhizobium sp. M0904 TaxID=2957022 RepID=UPI00333E173A